ncbi:MULTISPECIES: RDD family protein [unclassified Janthinobacterium]|uniref:RDD family protein n=1 Tax=unclassified Janthinobacterium TaxID=2610881 RepID=UPI001E63EED6|nr:MULTISPECIES: RDD family protein [unclassified Janthinobacterium]MCC7644443.1 RDD family protein [Janthinobacterium sp. EB271-G4-3-1]MCC7694025.1 RDD family protein [Janthinobacterium sp. EB271-G4-3-2]
MEYGGFWRRLGAFFIDMAIMLPLVVPIVYLGMPWSQSFLLYWFLPSLALSLAYNVVLVNRFGGTPGQLLCKLRVRMLDGSPVTRQAALLRYSVLLTLTTLTAIAGIIGILRIDENAYAAMTFTQISTHMARFKPSWSGMLETLAQLWIYSEFVVLLFNKKRRALQDFMAGTIVVKLPARAAQTPPLATTAT